MKKIVFLEIFTFSRGKIYLPRIGSFKKLVIQLKFYNKWFHMIKVLDMQFIRYANLFSQITRVRTNHCFEYNNMIVFVVPKKLVARSIGPNNINLEKLSSIIGKKDKDRRCS